MLQKQKITIGYVCSEDPFKNRKAWSGTIYKLRESIEKAGFEVIWIPVKEKSAPVLIWKVLLKIYKYTVGFGKGWLSGIHFSPIARIMGKQLSNNRQVVLCDFLFFPQGAQMMLYTNLNIPFIYHADAVIDSMFDYYFTNINDFSKRMAISQECSTVKAAAINIRASQWAIEDVMKYTNGTNSYVLELGPNLDIKDINTANVYKDGELRILFSGVDWKRKGGDFAVEVVEAIRKAGIDARMIIAGPKEMPEICKNKSYIDFVGFLDKNVDRDYKMYISLYKDSHIFLLPTKAECAGIVFSEASVFGVPSYTFLTGGTGNYVKDGINGHTFSFNDSTDVWANQIISDVRNNSLRNLHDGALMMARTVLSWDVWSQRFKEIIEDYRNGRK